MQTIQSFVKDSFLLPATEVVTEPWLHWEWLAVDDICNAGLYLFARMFLLVAPLEYRSEKERFELITSDKGAQQYKDLTDGSEGIEKATDIS